MLHTTNNSEAFKRIQNSVDNVQEQLLHLSALLMIYRGTVMNIPITTLKRLKKIWNERNIPLYSKIRLLLSLDISIFQYICETWTLTAELVKENPIHGGEALPKDHDDLFQESHVATVFMQQIHHLKKLLNMAKKKKLM